jgi:hypothetical protein
MLCMSQHVHAAGASYDDVSYDAHLPNLVSVHIPEEDAAYIAQCHKMTR